ncbi:MAG: hypothetical protein L0K86_01265 [Actinomycetia bacterium]|nr:hypothetical protein [Actinomycetes bacterium]
MHASIQHNRVVDWEWPPRVVVILVVAALTTRGLPSAESMLHPTIDLTIAAAFCVWLWFRKRLPTWVSVVSGAWLTVLGIYQGFGPADGVALFLGPSVIAVVQPVRRLPALIGGLALLMYLTWTTGGLDPSGAVTATADWLLIVFVIAMLERTYSTACELHRTQRLLAAEQVDQERLRVNDELAETLGCTFTTATDQIRRARALVDPDDTQVRRQLGDLADLVAQGFIQLKRLSFEPAVQDLEDELITARNLCHQLGVEMTVCVDELTDPRISEFAAVVVCESVTNMFKHAGPTRCVVVVREDEDEVILSVTNDGASESVRGPGGRSGQQRWRTQLRALGGTLESGRLSGGRYRALVRIPHCRELHAQAHIDGGSELGGRGPVVG